MQWSFRLGTFAGIPVRVHFTFLLLLAWAAARALSTVTPLGALLDLTFVLGVFASVVLHEYGHALTARRFGVRTRDIMLLPIGGVASLERMPRSPRQEFWIAIAGPATNLALAAALFAISLALGGLVAGGAWLAGQSFLVSLMWANLGLALFNLVPAFPMDGGRVFRALLARRRGYLDATITAATVGRAFAFAFGVVGLFTNPMLTLVAVFLWVVAGREAAAARWQADRGAATFVSPWSTTAPVRVHGRTPPDQRVIWVLDDRRRP